MPKKIHNIPYYSQLSTPDWEARGFASLEEAEYWQTRSCGIACIKMVLDNHKEHRGQKFADLVKEMEDKGVYKDGVGCVHQGIVDQFNARGIDSQRMKIDTPEKFKKLIDQDNIFIVSIGAGFIDGKKNGHLVPVIGYTTDKDDNIISLIVHNTSSYHGWQWSEKEIDVGRFMNHFSNNTIRVRLYDGQI